MSISLLYDSSRFLVRFASKLTTANMKKYLFLLIPFYISGCGGAIEPAIPKNIVVILADDHALKVTGSYGNKLIRTPGIDRLASEGVIFDHAYCNAPICSASRQSLLTGKYPHATGVNLLFTPFPDEGNTTIAEHLRTRGYQSAIIGKTHWNNWIWGPVYEKGTLPKHGFDTIIEAQQYRKFIQLNPPPALPEALDYYIRSEIDADDVAERMNWHVRPHPIDDAHSMGTFFAESAVDFMEKNHDTPFLVWLAFKEPHQPFYFPLEYAGKYNPDSMDLPSGSPEDDRWIPLQFRDLTEKERRGIIAAYYSSTEYMDKNIGLVLDAIDSLGIADNTIVIYISDNGYLLNEHKRFEKHTMWEEAVRQPLIIRDGSSFRPGERESALVEYVDVVPTLLDLAGVQPLKDAQGESFIKVLRDESEDHKSFALSTYLTDNLAMVTNKKWKYVFTTGSRDLGIGYETGYGPSGIVHRLYDLEEDPLEQTDVSSNPKNAKVLDELQRAMLNRFMETHPQAEKCPLNLTLEGKLMWFCEPRDIGDDQDLNAVPKRVFIPQP